MKNQNVIFEKTLENSWNEWITIDSFKMISDNPLLLSLEQGGYGKEELKLILAQHSYYSSNFIKYLCSILCQTNDDIKLNKLMDNLKEEMGFEDEDKVTHAEIYQKSLQAIGVNLDDYVPFEETLNLKQAMTKYCQSDDILEGLAALCLGAEAIVPLIYTPIYNALIANGYSGEATEFFRLHIQEDEDHALVMLDIIKELVGHNKESKNKVIRIGQELIELRNAMFNRIFQAIQETGERYKSRKTFYSSADFGNIPKELVPYIPQKLKHESVIRHLENEPTDDFSKARKHKVNVVDLPTKTISMTIGHLEQGQSTRLHRHNYETVIYVTEGKGYSVIGKRKVEWKKGDAIYIPIWSPHQHVNTSDGDCVYVACENAPLLQNLGEIALREELHESFV